LYIDAANLILSARSFNLQYDIKKLLIYLKEIIVLVEKEKGPAIHEKIEGALFNDSSISNTVNLSNHIFNKISKISL
jgi:hypothetical protein